RGRAADRPRRAPPRRFRRPRAAIRSAQAPRWSCPESARSVKFPLGRPDLPHWRDQQGGGLGALGPPVAPAGVPARVESALAAARAGGGRRLTVAGERGIGKTRLAEAAAERADGFAVVWTWGPAAAGGPALGPWSRVLRVLAGGHAAVARLIADSPFLAA